MTRSDQPKMASQLKDNYTLYYDGACPLCRKEVNWLKKRCASKSYQLGFIDISEPSFDPKPTGRSLEALMKALHLKGPDGEWWTAMDATRIIYREIGLGWLMAPTAWPVLKPIFDGLYAGFAKVRSRLQREPCDRCIR